VSAPELSLTIRSSSQAIARSRVTLEVVHGEKARANGGRAA
jgi:hypothetical protein